MSFFLMASPTIPEAQHIWFWATTIRRICNAHNPNPQRRPNSVKTMLVASTRIKNTQLNIYNLLIMCVFRFLGFVEMGRREPNPELCRRKSGNEGVRVQFLKAFIYFPFNAFETPLKLSSKLKRIGGRDWEFRCLQTQEVFEEAGSDYKSERDNALLPWRFPSQWLGSPIFPII